MDNMALNWDLPQEDELGTCQLTGGTSPYMPIMFMRNEKMYVRALYGLRAARRRRRRRPPVFGTALRCAALRWEERRSRPRSEPTVVESCCAAAVGHGLAMDPYQRTLVGRACGPTSVPSLTTVTLDS